MGCNSSTSSAVTAGGVDVEIIKDFHDQYILGVKLGRGAFAQVRACIKTQTEGALRADGKQISKPPERAVKILDLRDKNTPGEASRQLQKAAYNEATVWKTVGNHPNCIRLFDLVYSSEFCYMVMEKCTCGLLEHLESMPELSERTLGVVFLQMLLGIAHTHSVRVVHRDVKPDNFLVGFQDGLEGPRVVKLGDFGLSAILPAAGKLPGVYGTAPFMCPEMLSGKTYDEKADVWSIAVIAYVLLFGNFPYMPKEQSSKGMKQAIQMGTPPPSFTPVGKSSTTTSAYRSETALTFVKTLLNREPDDRPSAPESLNMAYMTASREGNHQSGTELPSLRPMMHMAKKVGAFEVRDPSRETGIDGILNQLQLKKHGRPLPEQQPSGGHRDRDRTNARMEPKDKIGQKGSQGFGHSNRSTACGSGSDMNASSGSSNFGGMHKGSGWSKGTGVPFQPSSTSSSNR
jgi:serine/threonine protein kinase